MAQTLETLKTRRSCKAFKPDAVEEDKIVAILEAGTYAANGMGKQSPIIIAVTNKEMRDKLSALDAAAKNQEKDPFYGAPAVICVLANKAVPTYVYDGSLVMGNLMNAASDLGVGSCWIFRAKEVFETQEGKAILANLGIEGEYEGIAFMALGYANGPLKEAAPRKSDYIYYIK